MVEMDQAQLSGKPDQGKTCFVASPIGAEGSDIRERSDLILEHVIEETVRPLGYTITRADQLAVAGSITSQIMSHLVTSDIAIFDLTGHNPNVFYELAIRHAAAKPYVQISDGSPLPFDVTIYRTIPLDYRDLRSVAQAKRTLADMVRAYEEGSIVETPLTNVPDVQTLLTAGNPIRDQLATITNLVMLLHGDLRGVRYNQTTNIEDVDVLQRFIQIYAENGDVPIENRTALEKVLQSPHLKEWARGLPTEAVAGGASRRTRL